MNHNKLGSLILTGFILAVMLSPCLCKDAQSAKPANSLPTNNRSVILYDNSRGMFIKLTDTQAFFQWASLAQGINPNGWDLIAENPTGRWVSGTKFVENTGYFQETNATSRQWIEKKSNSSQATHYFVQITNPPIRARGGNDDRLSDLAEQPKATVGNSPAPTYVKASLITEQPETSSKGFLSKPAAPKASHLIVLYDESRQMFVKITDTQVFFQWGSLTQGINPTGWYLIAENSTGKWISDTKFVDDTGYFMETNAASGQWIEQKNDSPKDVHHFVQVTTSQPV